MYKLSARYTGREETKHQCAAEIDENLDAFCVTKKSSGHAHTLYLAGKQEHESSRLAPLADAINLLGAERKSLQSAEERGEKLGSGSSIFCLGKNRRTVCSKKGR